MKAGKCCFSSYVTSLFFSIIQSCWSIVFLEIVQETSFSLNVNESSSPLPPTPHPFWAELPAIFLSPICLATACCWVNGETRPRSALLLQHLHFTTLPFQDSMAVLPSASWELWMPAQVQHSLCCHYACHLSSPGCQQIFSGLTQIQQWGFCLVQNDFWTPRRSLPFFSKAITLFEPQE